jgi:hypothetical protein
MTRPSLFRDLIAAALVTAGSAWPATSLACTPQPLLPGAQGSNICWGDMTWPSKSDHHLILEQTFDFYPSNTGPMAPLIVYFHPDGATSHIAPGSYADVNILEPALQAGYAFATVEYRHPVDDDNLWNAPDDPRVPHWDASRATQFLRAYAAQLGFDKRQVFFVGHSRGALSLWTAEQPDMADPGSPDPVSRESSRALAAFEYQGQSTFRDREFARLFLVPADRPASEASFEAEHPKWRQFGSAIASVDATSPPVQLRYRDTYPGHLITSAEMQTYGAQHYPGYGPKLCDAYRAMKAPGACIVEYEVPTPHAFDGYLDFFAAYRLK